MGDRCYLQITFRVTDEDVVKKTLGRGFDELESDGIRATGVINECNYAAWDEREELAKLGIPFTGWHHEGGEYGPAAFASHGTGMSSVNVDHDGYPVCRIRYNADLDQIQLYPSNDDPRLYFRMEKRADALLNPSSQDPPTDPTTMEPVDP